MSYSFGPMLRIVLMLADLDVMDHKLSYGRHILFCQSIFTSNTVLVCYYFTTPSY